MSVFEALSLMFLFGMFILALLTYLKKKVDRPLTKVCGLLTHF